MIASKAADIRHIMAEIVQDNLKYLGLFQIENKQRQTISFDPLAIQQGILRAIDSEGCRNVILKPAQVGATTCIVGYYLADTLIHQGTTSVVVAFEEFITTRLLAKAQFMYDKLPEEIRPEMGHSSSHEKTFPSINSTMYIGSARAFTFGRGEVIHNFLADEYGFWFNTAHIMVPVLQRVPPSGRINVLSTANGEDNDFARLYKSAKEGRSQWQALFFPWFCHEEYTLEPNNNYALPQDKGMLEFLEDVEVKLMEDADVDEDQIRWRRAKIAELMEHNRTGESALLFPQEFPEDDESCFVVAGDMIYEPEVLADLYQKALYQKPLNKEKGVNIYEEPEDGIDYSLVCDPGMGRQTLTAFCVIYWWEDEGVEYGKVVATFLERLETSDTVDLLVYIGRKYHIATICSEENNHGVAVLNGLVTKRYPRIYKRIDIVKKKKTSRLGWATTKKSKPFMIKRLKEVMENMEIPDPRFISQCRALRWGKNNKGETIIVSVGDDDAHDALAIGAAIRDTSPITKGFKGVSGYGRGGNSSW